jgi:V/A-type H+-transporting ATPase subunit A
VFDLVNRSYQFKDKSAIRDYFVRLTGLFKNLNYSQEETAQYKEFLGKIQQLADSTVNQNVKSAPAAQTELRPTAPAAQTELRPTAPAAQTEPHPSML